MIDVNKHIIKRHIVDVTVSDKNAGSEVQDRISKLYNSTIIPILDEVFCDLNLTEEIIRIDQLELDLGNLRLENLTDDLRIRLKSKLEDEMVKIVYHAKINNAQKGVEVRKFPHLSNDNKATESLPQNINGAEKLGSSNFSVFEEYVTTGLIPWWSAEKQKDIPQLIGNIIQSEWNEKEVSRILSLLRFRNVRHRLINTLKNSDLTIFFSKISKEKGKKLMNLASEIQRLFDDVDKKQSARKFVRIEILDVLIREIILPKSIPKVHDEGELASSIVGDFLLKNFDAAYSRKFQSKVQQLREWNYSLGKKEDFETSLSNRLKTTSASVEVLRKDKKLIIDLDTNINSIAKSENFESLLVKNAGLIIIWPYLEIFFRGLGLLDAENQFDSESSIWRAIQLLHYLAFGKEVAEESELILNKLICNLPIESSVPLTFELSEEEKLECENLLKAVLQNWKALKSTSTAGLKQSFIMREGVFSKDQSGWTLSIERKSYDLLLDKLSWPISILKFPWNPNLIHVRW